MREIQSGTKFRCIDEFGVLAQSAPSCPWWHSRILVGTHVEFLRLVFDEEGCEVVEFDLASGAFRPITFRSSVEMFRNHTTFA